MSHRKIVCLIALCGLSCLATAAYAQERIRASRRMPNRERANTAELQPVQTPIPIEFLDQYLELRNGHDQHSVIVDTSPAEATGDIDPCIGACCDALTGECADRVELWDCFGSGGSFTAGMTCDEVDCPPLGACCVAEAAECTDDVTLNDCFAAGGEWSQGTACADLQCPAPPLTGACCIVETGECTDDVDFVECIVTFGGFSTIGATCADSACPPTGACCDPLTSECADDVTLPDCQMNGGISFPNEICELIECPMVQVGACCDPINGVCLDGVREFECGGLWSADTVCADVDCPPVGACCDPHSGSCTDGIARATCEDRGGLWSADRSCADLPCPGDLSCGAVNSSFESGNFSGWIAEDLAGPFFPLSVVGSGLSLFTCFFETDPTDGAYAALNGWDGAGPGSIVLAQDIDIPENTTTLSFDYRAAWLLNVFGATKDRTFQVSIRPAGGGAPLEPPHLILTAVAGTVETDTGEQTASLDVSPYAGMTVRLHFEWFIPEAFSGPAQFQLDNIRCEAISPCDCINGKVTICHRPPGNPDNARTLRVGCSALNAHLGHGDSCGPCE